MDIPFRDWGGDGPLLHFSHANAYPAGCYRQLLEPWTAHFHVLTAAHRPVWPGSDPRWLTSWQQLADDLIAFCDAQGVRQAVGVGHSLGAVVTMFAALRRPELFERLVLIEPVFLPEVALRQLSELTVAESLVLQPLAQAALRRRNRWPGRQAAFDHFRPKSVFAGFSDASLWDFVNEGLHDAEQGVTLAFPRAWEAQIYATVPVEVWDVLPGVTQPTLAIRGGDSTTLFRAQWARWQALQPAATFVELPGVGHLLPFEAPALAAQTVAGWLELPGSP